MKTLTMCLTILAATTAMAHGTGGPKKPLILKGEDARKMALAVGGQRALPYNVFTVCDHDTNCSQYEARLKQNIDPAFVRRLLQTNSADLRRVQDPKQLLALRRELDRMGQLTTHIDGFQAECTQLNLDVACVVTNQTEFED